VRRNNIYSPSWTKLYGITAYTTTTTDYSCTLNPFTPTNSSSLKILSGKIDGINNNVMNITGGNGDKYTIYLGSCTVIENVGQQNVPVKGYSTYISATDRKGGPKGHYDGYHVACY
jgi:hypothetical protein